MKDELRPILPIRYDDGNRVAKPLAGIVLFEPPSQAVRLHPDNRVFLRIEIGGPAERLYRDAVFLDLIAPAFQMAFTNVAKESA